MCQGVEEVLVRPFLPAYRRGKPGAGRAKMRRVAAPVVGRRNTEGRMAGVLGDEIDVLAKARRAMPGDYVPSDDETYMSEPQLDYFRRLLLEWKKSILSASAGTLSALQDGPLREPDLNDRASSETDWGIELRTRDRQRKLIAKIDSAMRRIDEGEYGFCEVTGEPIGLGRLIARPIATMTVEAQEAHERREKISRDM
jgi:DnaK suppressor protein